MKIGEQMKKQIKLLSELEMCFSKMKTYFSDEDLAAFAQCSFYNLSLYHFTFGIWIRNTMLDEGGSLYTLFVEGGLPCKDGMSSLLMQLFYLYVRTEHKDIL